MLNLRLPGHHRDGRLPTAYFVDPIVFPKRAQALGYRFIKGIDGYLNGVLDPSQVATGNGAGADAHGSQNNRFALSSPQICQVEMSYALAFTAATTCPYCNEPNTHGANDVMVPNYSRDSVPKFDKE